MLKQALLIASTAAATLVAVPDSAEARHRSYYGGGYAQPYYGSSYGYYPQSYGYGYQQPYYGRQRYYGSDRYYGGRRHYGYRRHRCGNGTTGLIVGAAGGALLGREIERGGSRTRYYGRRNSGTTGAIIGGAVGALVGRGIARSC